MERGPSQPERHGIDPEAKDKKRKDKKRRFAAPLPIETDAVDKTTAAEKPAKPSAVDEALARLAVVRKETRETVATKEPEEPPADEAAEETSEAADTDETVAIELPSEASDVETYESLPGYELGPTELSAGEVVIQLQGDAPVFERVISLHEPVTGQAEETPPGTNLEAITAEVLPAWSNVAPSALPGSGGGGEGGGGETPPPAAPDVPSPAPRGEADPVMETIHESAEPVMATTLPQQEIIATHTGGGEGRPVSKQELEDALYRATRVGEHRGALTGLLVGGATEHFIHKGREKRAARRFERQTRQFNQEREAAQAHRAEQDQWHGEQVRRLDAVEQRLEKQSPLPEQHGLQSSDERPDIPKEHRLETSAWHTIEVDAKTGKAVENPTFAYGHEYYRERAVETAPVQQRNAAAGEVALVAAAAGVADSNSVPSDIPDATTQGPPPRQSKQTATRASKATATVLGTSTTPIWPWLVALVVIVVCLALLLR